MSADIVDARQEVFPLDVFFCADCTHLQLLDVVDPSLLFSQYVYVSGTSPTFVKHFSDYVRSIADLVGSVRNQLVVDIGSNDGTLLRAFRDEAGAKVLGVDPASNLAEIAAAAGVETIWEFFTPLLARQIATSRGKAKVVTANNVFAHIDDLVAVLDGVKALLAADGVFVFEVSYLVDVVEKLLFDTIYHEHLSYHAVRPLVPFLKAHDLELIEAIRVSSHGGSLRGIVQHANGPRRAGRSVAEALALEQRLGLERLATYEEFATRIDALGEQLKTMLTALKSQGKAIAGFGAPAKLTTLMYHFGLDRGLVDFIVDDSPLKQGMFTPGMHIPVVPPEAIAKRKPDYLLILAWNFADAIIAKNRAFLGDGGHLIVPLPKLLVV